MDWDNYHPLDDIYGWFDYLEHKLDFCQFKIIGKSFKNRDMKVMKVSSRKNVFTFILYFISRCVKEAAVISQPYG